MTTDKKPEMYGPSATHDPTTHEPSAGKTALMGQLVTELVGKPTALAKAINNNCTTSLFLKDCGPINQS